MSDFLASMAESSEARAAEAKRSASEADLRRAIASMPPPPAWRAAPFALIAEVKTSSPSEGRIAAGPVASGAEDNRVRTQARAYARVEGVAAISVLTEPTRFGGSMAHLRACAAEVSAERVPCMRKDFLVDPYQVIEGRAAGAGGVLVIVRMLEEAVLRAMVETADELGLFTVIEAFDERDLERAGRLLEGLGQGGGATRGGSPRLVGINTRDLVTLKVEPERLERLAGGFPAGCVRVAESGLATAEDAARVARLGYGAALVGTALMRSAEPERLAGAMVAAGRAGLLESSAGRDE